MTNIRISRFSIKNSSEIQITFTSNLNTNISINSILITGAYSTDIILTILSLAVSKNILTIKVRPMVDGMFYKLILTDISGAHGEQFIEDGTSNSFFFVGQIEDNNIRDNILNNIPSIYNKDPGSLIFNSINCSTKELEKSLNTSGEVDSSGYVSIEVLDEEMVRGSGAFDRFSKEGVFQLLRVGKTPTTSNEEKILSYNSFPETPISLQQELVNNEVVSNTSDIGNSFDGLIIKLAKKPVIIVNSIILVQNGIEYAYDINQYKYGLLNYKYDTNSYQALDLESNEIKLSSASIGPSFPLPQVNDYLLVNYYYRKEGRLVDASGISVFKVVDKIRESIPSVANTFFLNNAPIVDETGSVFTRGGILWLDPVQNFDPTKKHPAFITEISYSQFNLPSLPGQFSVDYETGRVFVFGVNGSGTDGTTVVAPTATYKYLKTYQNNLDYIFYSDLNEIASIPNRDLRFNPALVSFQYEETFANNVDFKFKSHIEVLNERVENRLIENIGLYTKNYPVNEVFRIYNETTGEIYNPTRIFENQVYFNAINPPNIVNKDREPGVFNYISQSELLIIENITIPGKSFFAIKIELQDSFIGSSTGNLIGANYNSSLVFSNKSLFMREFFFDQEQELEFSLLKLKKIGDYVVDYINGVVYLAYGTTITDVGDATYRVATFKTRNKHIINVNNVYRSSQIGQNVLFYDVNSIEDQTILVNNISSVGEKEILVTDIYGNTTSQPVQVISDSIEVSNDIHRLYHIYQITDLETNHNPIDFVTGASVSSSTPNIINISSSGVSISDDGDGYGILIQFDGRAYIDAYRTTELFNDGLIELISAVNVVDVNTGENYLSYGSDHYIDALVNRIYLPTNANFSVGNRVNAVYKSKILNGAAVLVDYSIGDVFIDYSYTTDEILINYEYGDNILDWSVSDALYKDDTYYVSYRYGAMRNQLRDNFGLLTGLDELGTIPDDLDRETYRNAVLGALQTFPKGPTIPSLNKLVNSLTKIDPQIVETVFLEWILGRDNLNLESLKLNANSIDEMPTYDVGNFSNGLLLNKLGQTAILPASSNIRFNEGTWESFITPKWDGIENDATLTFDIKSEGNYNLNKIFIGNLNINPSSVPFSLTALDAVGVPSLLHIETGYFIWYDIDAKKWRFRVRESVGISPKLFAGTIETSGDFYNVSRGATADGYKDYYFQDGYYNINEITDRVTSTDKKIKFSFTIDGYDQVNNNYDAYDSYSMFTRGGFDGIDFSSDEQHYIFDTGVSENYCRMSLYKDGKGYLHFKVIDGNRRVKMLSANIQDWGKYNSYHVACSWKIGTIEQRDELHLFINGVEIPNSYRYRGFIEPPLDAYFMDQNSEILYSSATKPTIGGFDLSTTAGSNLVVSLGSSFITSGVSIGDKFEILDNTTDGVNTRVSPYVYIQSVGSNYLTLQTGDGYDFNAIYTLDNVSFSVNPLKLRTLSDNDVEKVRVFSNGIELYTPGSLEPQYSFLNDGYLEYVNIYDGVSIGDDITLKSYGLMQSRFRQYVYMWSSFKTNLLNTIMPQPTDNKKINIRKVILQKFAVGASIFTLIATNVGGHIIPVVHVYAEDFCQPSNVISGRKMSATVSGNNINWSSGINYIIIDGMTQNGFETEGISFSGTGTKSTVNSFTHILNITIALSPINPLLPAGFVEVKEADPINWQNNNGDYAQVFLSIQQQAGNNGNVNISTDKFTDAYSRFGGDDIGKILNIISPPAISGVYKIRDVDLDPSLTVKDSSTITLETYGGSTISWSGSYSNISWKLFSVSYGDSGFANGLITLEIANSGGQPFLLDRCWYEIDFPTYLEIPWPEVPRNLYIGSDMNGEKQANAVIDEMRILDELSVDTGKGSAVPSSGRSITTDALSVSEFSPTVQSLGLFHFNDDVINDAGFYSSFSGEYRQSENSVNADFKQCAVFNTKKSLKIDNKSIFNNKSGTIEFWVSPLLDTYNDPTKRYYIDLTPAQNITLGRTGSYGIISDLLVRLPLECDQLN